MEKSERIVVVLRLLRKLVEDYKGQHLNRCHARPTPTLKPVARHCTCSWDTTVKQANDFVDIDHVLAGALRIYMYAQQNKFHIHADSSCYRRCTCSTSTMARLIAIAGHLRALGVIQRDSGVTYLNHEGERIMRLAREALSDHIRAGNQEKAKESQATQEQDSAS